MSDKPQPAAPGERTHNLDDEAQWAGRRRILILDDDAAFADLTRAYLQVNGYEVDVVPDGVSGIKKILVMDYAVILCDIVMPNMAGDMFYTAVERVKPHLCKRIIFVTGKKGDRKVEDFIRKVRCLVLWKPFPQHQLIEAVRTVEAKAFGSV